MANYLTVTEPTPCLPDWLSRIASLTELPENRHLMSQSAIDAAGHWLPIFARTLEPCEVHWLSDQIIALFSVFPQQAGFGPENWAARCLAYTEDLAEFPPDIVTESIRMARRAADTFCPSPKTIRDQAIRLLIERRKLHFSLRRVAKAVLILEPPAVPDPAQQAAMSERIDAIVAKWRERPPLPSKLQYSFEAKKRACLAAFDRWVSERSGEEQPAPETRPSRLEPVPDGGKRLAEALKPRETA